MFEPLPALIRLQRKSLRLSLDALSALSGVSRSRLAALEKGDENITLAVLVKIASSLEMTELRIGGLYVKATTPDFNVLVAAAEALVAAREIVDRARGAGDQLDRISERVAELLEPVITRERRRAAPSGEPDETAVERLAELLARTRAG